MWFWTIGNPCIGHRERFDRHRRLQLPGAGSLTTNRYKQLSLVSKCVLGLSLGVVNRKGKI